MKIYRQILVSLALTGLCFGGQGLVIPPGVRTTSLTDPNIADMQSYTVEDAWRAPTLPISTSIIYDLNGIGITAELTSTSIQFTDKRDTASGLCRFDITARTQFTTRITRDVSGLKFSCEIWNINGSSYSLATRTISSVNAWAFSGGAVGDNGGGTATNISWDFHRVYTSILTLGSKPPTTFWTGGTTTTEPGTSTAWKLDGNGNDSSGNGNTITTGAFSFSATTNQGPEARWTVHSSIGPWASAQPSWSDWLTLKVGTAEPLDGSNAFSMADACNTVTHVWSKTSGPTATLGNTTSALATANASAFGTYVFRDTVTDCNAATAYEDLQVGAAPFNSSGVLDWLGVFGGDTAKADIASSIFGPAIAFGQSTSELVDLDHQQFSEAYGDVYGIPSYPTPWNTALAGTITCTVGMTACTGSGTAFQTDFPGCDATHPPTDKYLVLLYQDAVNIGRIGRTYKDVFRCPSNTSLTLLENLVSQTPCTACQYAQMPQAAAGPILSTVGSAEYAYCNGCAYYMLYWRSGNSKYLDYARSLYDWLLPAPGIDGGVFFATAPRIFPIIGPFLRMTLDDKVGDSTYALFLHNMENRCQTGADYISDTRETGTQCLAIALGANWDPDLTIRATMKAAVKSAYDARFSKLYHQDGAERWYVDMGLEPHGTTVYAVTNGSATVTRSSGAPIPTTACGTISTRAGTIAPTNASTAVVGTGTSFTGKAGKAIIIFGTLSSVYYKQVFTIASVADATHLTLVQKWYGDTASGLSFVIIDYPVVDGNGYIPIGWIPSDASGNLLPDTVNTIVYPQNPNPADEWSACTWVDGNTLTLDKVFTGVTGFSRISYYEFAPNGIKVVPGMPGAGGTQPILYASLLKMFRLGYKVWGNTTDGNNQLAMAQGIEAFLRTSGYDPVSKGLYYEIKSPPCTPSLPESLACNSATPGARDYSSEANDAFNQRYLDDPSGANRTAGDQFFGAQYGCPGYLSPYSDGICGGTATPGEITGASNPKHLGFRFGAGAGWAWPAIRTLSGVPTLTSISPVTGRLGTAVSMTLTGTGFVDGDSTVNVDGSGISVSNTTVVSTTSITATFTISNPVTGRGVHNVTVTTSAGTTGTQTFTVDGALTSTSRLGVSTRQDLKMRLPSGGVERILFDSQTGLFDSAGGTFDER